MSQEHKGPPAGRSAPLTNRDVLAVAVPIILSNVTTPLIGVVDTAVLGQLGDPHYIGAVAVGAMIFSMLFWGFGFLRMGTTGLTAQAEGAGDGTEVVASLTRALLIAGVAGLCLIALQGPIARAAFWLVEGSAAVEGGAQEYLSIRIWSAPAALANYAILGWFIGLGKAGTAFKLQLILNGANAALDALFVMGLGMTVDGVAIGTLIAECLTVAAGLWLVHGELRRRGLAPDLSRVLDRAGLGRAITVNRDIMIRTLCLIFAFCWFTAQSAAGGDLTLAANAVLLNFLHVSAYFLDGFAFAAESLVGKAVGARDRTRFRDAARRSSAWAVLLAALTSLAFWFGGGLAIDGLTVNPEVRLDARDYLIWAALAPILGVACFQLDGIFIGATRTADMRDMMIVSLVVYLAAWWGLTAAFGNHGLWASILVFFIVRAITLGMRFPALRRDLFGAPAIPGAAATARESEGPPPAAGR